MKTATARDAMVTRFSAWLIESGQCDHQRAADREAWDFVASAWDGDDDDLDTWIEAWKDAREMTTEFQTEQRAYVGRWALLDVASGKLLHGGGVLSQRPRLYDSKGAAEQAARDMSWTEAVAVLLV